MYSEMIKSERSNKLPETGTVMQTYLSHCSAGSGIQNSHEKGPDDEALTLLFPLVQLGFFVHHHPRDRHVGVLLPGFPDGLGQRLRGQERAL